MAVDRSGGAQAWRTTSRGSSGRDGSASRPPDLEVAFGADDDPTNPRCWPLWYRAWIITAVSFSTWVVVFYSTGYAASMPGMMDEFGIEDTTTGALGMTAYLLGLAAGSPLAAPASELYGRRPVYIFCMLIFTLLLIPACLATSLNSIIIVRFIGACFGAVMICISAGTVVDISTEENRGLTMSIWSIAPLNGPITGPLIGGYIYQYLGWRWDYWLVVVLSGLATICMVLCKETYEPIILQKKAARLREETKDGRYWTRFDVPLSKLHLIGTSFLRPIHLAFTEPILWFFNIWISVVYGILYLCFVAYPIVFTEQRGWGAGMSGLAFVGIGTGTMLAILAEPLIRRLINRHPTREPDTGEVPPEAVARIMIVGAVCVPIGQLGFSWTCLPTSIHWALPVAFGLPFGFGNSICFIYGSNYLASAYGIYSASALAGNAVMRSVFGAALPLAGPAMYAALTPRWAGTLLGLLELCMLPIPIIFYRYGESIRAKSPVIRRMRQHSVADERRAARARARKASQQDGSTATTGVVVEDEEKKAHGAWDRHRLRDVEKAPHSGPSLLVLSPGDVKAGP